VSEHERCVIFSFFFAFLSLLFFCFGLTNHNSQSKAVQQTRAKKKTRERENLWSHLVLSSFRPFLYFPKSTHNPQTLGRVVSIVVARAGTSSKREREREINNNARNHGAPDCDDDDENVAMVWTQRAQSDEEEDYHRNRSFRFFHIG